MIRTNEHIFLKYINILKSLVLLKKTETVDIDFIGIIDKLTKENNSQELLKVKELYLKDNLKECNNELNKLKFEIINSLFKKPCKIDFFNDLINTSQENIKYCSNCNKNVYLVNNEKELKKRTNLEQCIAFDINSIGIKNIDEINFKSCHVQFEEDWTIGLPNFEIKPDINGVF